MLNDIDVKTKTDIITEREYFVYLDYSQKIYNEYFLKMNDKNLYEQKYKQYHLDLDHSRRIYNSTINLTYVPTDADIKNENAILKLKFTLYKDSIVLWIDQNNDGSFLDDNSITINSSNYDEFVKNRKIKVTNLISWEGEKKIYNSIDVRINQLFQGNKIFPILNVNDFIPTIDFSEYFEIRKNIFSRQFIQLSILKYPLEKFDYWISTFSKAAKYHFFEKVSLNGVLKIGRRNYRFLNIDYKKRKVIFKETKDSIIYVQKSKETINKYDNIDTIRQNHLINQFKQTFFLEDLILNNSSILVLDFWASWCKPCRAEIPYIKKMESEFKDMPVKFISISLDTDVDSWLNALEMEALDKSNAYLMSDSWQSDFIYKNNIYTIPRYLIVGFDGLVKFDNTLRPSNPAFKELISEMLSQKNN